MIPFRRRRAQKFIFEHRAFSLYGLRNFPHFCDILDSAKDYFLKLSEKVGETARAIGKNPGAPYGKKTAGTVDEKLRNAIYRAIAPRISMDIDLEQVIKTKPGIRPSPYLSEANKANRF